MRTNLIQAYINDNSNARQRYNSDNAKKNFDVNKELSNRTFIKPLQSNGQLVSNSLFYAPAEFLKDVKYNANALKHSIQGTAKDKELGNLNDMGMKLGGLAIASYLFTKKQTPVTKLMEFVGFGTFFAAMNIWPKLALQLPAYLIHGFNIRQEYRDNYGTKKPVFLDHQFIPWDLYSDEQINKIGNRLGVPKDMKNRRDFIQEKMRKIALQNNTMWMLTSGLATPIMSALMCDVMQKPIANYIARKNDKKAEALLKYFNDEAKKYDFTAKNAELSEFLTENKGKRMSEELIKDISKHISRDLDTLTANALNRDLQNILKPNGYDISKENFVQLSQTLQKEAAKLPNGSSIVEFIPTADEIIEKLAQNEKEIFNSGNTKNNVVNFNEYILALKKAVNEKINNKAQNSDPKFVARIKFNIENLLKLTDETKDVKIIKPFKSKSSGILSEDTINRLTEINKAINGFSARQNILDRYAFMKAAYAPETSLANSWNNFLSDDVLETIGISDKEIKDTRLDSKLVHKLIRTKFEDIVADPAKYDAVIRKLNDKLCALENETNFAIYDNKKAKTPNAYKSSVEQTYNNASNKLRELGLRFTPERLTGYEAQDSHTLKNLQLSFVNDRATSIRNSFYRILNTLDMFKRVSSINYDTFFGANMPLQAKEDMVEMCKELLLGGHSSDYAIKFYFPRNTDLNNNLDNVSSPTPSLKIENGKNVYKYVGNVPKSELADMPYDIDFYIKSLRLMYTENLHDDTWNKIKYSTFYDDYIDYRKKMFAVSGEDAYFAKPEHLTIDPKDAKPVSSEYRFNLLGCSVDEVFTKLFSSKYNSKKWMHTFGGLGLALLGVTVISQFFMGHMPTDKSSKGGNK